MTFAGKPFQGREGLVVPVRVDPTGRAGPTRKQARGPRWRRSSHGFYVPAEVDRSVPEQRIVEAVPFLLDTHAVWARTAVTGWAALRWLGARWLDGTTAGGSALAPVPLLLGPDHDPQPGFTFSEERRSYTNFFLHDGLPLTDPWRSTCYEMRYAAGVRQAVVALDMACHANLVSVDEMAAHLALYNGWTGIPKAREALLLGDENSWSPQETRMRLVWVIDCGFPHPLCNVPIFDRNGRHLLTPDLFDPDAGVCGEYDGAVHLERNRRGRDRDREELARDHGLEYFTVLAGELGSSRCANRMRAARARGRFQDEDHRRWTLEPPYWWTPTESVAQRRALPPEDRLVWLGEAG